ncbi:MAG: NAD-dependent epimerase/dehydratase family protein [Myxococcota bacterium]
MDHDPELALTPEQLAPLGRCLVTGGAGYFGRTLAAGLLAAGRPVRLFDLHAHPVARALEARGAELVLGDVRDTGAVAAALEGIDTVFHTAAIIDGRTHVSARDRDRSVSVNVEGTRNVLEAARQGGAKRFVHTSSINVVFDRPLPDGAEDTPYASRSPLDLYTTTKIEAERLVLAANGERFATCAIRPGGIYGPGEETHLPRVTELTKKGLFRAAIGPGSARADNVYIDDLVDAALRAALALAGAAVGGTGAAAGRAYFIGDGEPQNYFAFFRPAVEQLGHRHPTASVPAWLVRPAVLAAEGISRLGGPAPFMSRMELRKVTQDHFFSTEPAARDFGHVPRVGPGEGFERCASWIAQLAAEVPLVKRPHLAWWLAIGFGLGLTFLLALSGAAYAAVASALPGFEAVFPRAVVQAIAVVAALLHVGEGLYAYRLAGREGLSGAAMGWGLQTLALGYPSLRLLQREVATKHAAAGSVDREH